MEEKPKCIKCKGTRRILNSQGVIGPCWDCLNSGAMDQHDKNPKDSGIKI